MVRGFSVLREAQALTAATQAFAATQPVAPAEVTPGIDDPPDLDAAAPSLAQLEIDAGRAVEQSAQRFGTGAPWIQALPTTYDAWIAALQRMGEATSTELVGHTGTFARRGHVGSGTGVLVHASDGSLVVDRVLRWIDVFRPLDQFVRGWTLKDHELRIYSAVTGAYLADDLFNDRLEELWNTNDPRRHAAAVAADRPNAVTSYERALARRLRQRAEYQPIGTTGQFEVETVGWDRFLVCAEDHTPVIHETFRPGLFVFGSKDQFACGKTRRGRLAIYAITTLVPAVKPLMEGDYRVVMTCRGLKRLVLGKPSGES